MTQIATAKLPRMVGIAELVVVTPPEQLRTVLGSCVAVALWDPRTRIAGMAHVILPTAADGTGERGKFADTAIDDLVEMMRAAGAGQVRAKLAGGARMFGPPVEPQGPAGTALGLGERNIEAVRERLRYHEIAVAAEHLGGVRGRKVTLDALTGALEIRMVGEPVLVI
jgi:chemotaxis protein CheD